MWQVTPATFFLLVIKNTKEVLTMITQNNPYDLPGWGDILYQREMQAQKEAEEMLNWEWEDNKEIIREWAEETCIKNGWGLFDFNDDEDLRTYWEEFYEDWDRWGEDDGE